MMIYWWMRYKHDYKLSWLAPVRFQPCEFFQLGDSDDAAQARWAFTRMGES